LQFVSVPSRHRLAVLAAAVTSLLAVPAAGIAAEQRPLEVSPSSVAAGEEFTVAGDCPAEAGGQLLAVLAAEGFDGGLLGRVGAEDDGSFVGQVAVHENSPATTGTVTVVCDVDNVVVSGELTVTGPDSDDEPSAPEVEEPAAPGTDDPPPDTAEGEAAEVGEPADEVAGDDAADDGGVGPVTLAAAAAVLAAGGVGVWLLRRQP
jgi:hypothetical protein